jgi:hypothetical protein
MIKHYFKSKQFKILGFLLHLFWCLLILLTWLIMLDFTLFVICSFCLNLSYFNWRKFGFNIGQICWILAVWNS